MRNSHCRTCGEKTQKKWIMRHKHCLIWNMARTLKNMENENYTLQDLDYGEKKKQKKKKNVKNETQTLQVEYGKKTEKRGH